MASTPLEFDFGIQYRKVVRNQTVNELSRLETERHDSAEIDDDLPDDLTIGAIADNNDALDLSDTYDDRHPYQDTFIETGGIVNVTTAVAKDK